MGACKTKLQCSMDTHTHIHTHSHTTHTHTHTLTLTHTHTHTHSHSHTHTHTHTHRITLHTKYTPHTHTHSLHTTKTRPCVKGCVCQTRPIVPISTKRQQTTFIRVLRHTVYTTARPAVYYCTLKLNFAQSTLISHL